MINLNLKEKEIKRKIEDELRVALYQRFIGEKAQKGTAEIMVGFLENFLKSHSITNLIPVVHINGSIVDVSFIKNEKA